MAATIKDLGKVTAYAYAKAAGYTGTEEQFQAIFNEFTENAPGLIDRMDTAVARAEAAVTNIDATIQDAVDDAVDEATASAVATANQAVTDAQAAQTAAEGAVTRANAAVTAAQAAQSAAEDAAESFVIDRTLTDSGAAAPADLVGDLKESFESHNAAIIRKDNAVKFTAPNGQYDNIGIYKDGNVIIANQTFANDTHKFNLTGTLIKDVSGSGYPYKHSVFPEAYVDDIPEFILGHIYKINIYAYDGSYTLDQPEAQFCYLKLFNKNSGNDSKTYANNSVFYCTEKPQGIFAALRRGTYNCKIAIEIVDITKELEIPDIGNNLLQIFDKITGIGDSLMAGYTSATNPITDSETAKTRKANWPSYLGADISRDITNLAVGSSSWKNWRYGTGNTDLSSADIDTNCYLVGLGVNDSIQENTVGTSADIMESKENNADSVYGNADYVIRTLHSYNENAHIFVFTSPVSNTNSDAINDAIRYIANLYNYVHCIDIDALYRNDFGFGAISKTLAGSHYNPLGYRIIANYIASAINSFMLSNYTLFAKVPYTL